MSCYCKAIVSYTCSACDEANHWKGLSKVDKFLLEAYRDSVLGEKLNEDFITLQKEVEKKGFNISWVPNYE